MYLFNPLLIVAKPFQRLHRSSRVIGLLTTALMALVVLPGVDSGLRDDKSIPIVVGFHIEDFEHGWPAVFMRRRVNYAILCDSMAEYLDQCPSTPLLGIPWLSLNAWQPWESSECEFSPWNLLLDLAVGLAIIFSFTLAWELRRRCQPRFMSFRLSELFLLVTILCTVFGWLTFRRSEYYREEPFIESLEQSDSLFIWPYRQCTAPAWLLRMLGAELIPQYFWRATEATIDTRNKHSWKPNEPELHELLPLKYLRTIEISGPMPKGTHSLFFMLSGVPQLRSLDLSDLDLHVPLDAPTAEHLSQMQQLTKVRFLYRTDVTSEAEEILRTRMPSCQLMYWHEGHE